MTDGEIRAGIEALQAALCDHPDHWLELQNGLHLRGIGGLPGQFFETFRTTEGGIERGQSPEKLEVFGHFGRLRSLVRSCSATPTPIPDRDLVERLAAFDASFAAQWAEWRASGALLRRSEATPAVGYRGATFGRPPGWWAASGRPPTSVAWIESATLVDQTRRDLWNGTRLEPASAEYEAFVNDLLDPKLLLERLREGRVRLCFGIAYYWDVREIRSEGGQLIEHAHTGEWIDNLAHLGWPVDTEEPVFADTPVTEDRVRALLAGEKREKLVDVAIA